MKTWVISQLLGARARAALPKVYAYAIVILNMICDHTVVSQFECKCNALYRSKNLGLLISDPKTWNGLPVDLSHLPNSSQFHHLLKTVLFRLAWVGSASE